MRVIRDGIQLCNDCTMLACSGDETGFDCTYGARAAERIAECYAGLERLGPHLVPAFDSEAMEGITEFTYYPCECCGSKLGGERHEFAVLGDA